MKIQDRKRRQKMENIEKLSKTKSNKEDKSGESLLGKSRHGNTRLWVEVCLLQGGNKYNHVIIYINNELYKNIYLIFPSLHLSVSYCNDF